MAVYGLARRCLQGGLLHFVRKDSAGHCEERSDAAIHGWTPWCLRGGLLPATFLAVAMTGWLFAMTRYRLCEERSDAAVH